MAAGALVLGCTTPAVAGFEGATAHGGPCLSGVCVSSGDGSTPFEVDGAKGGSANPVVHKRLDSFISSITRTKYVAACSGNTVERADLLCTYAQSCADPLATRFWVYQEVVTIDRHTRPPTTREGPWTNTGEACVHPADVPTVHEIVDGVSTGFIRKVPAEPELVVRPAPRVLVTAQNGFSAGSAEPVFLSDTVLGLPVVITATPRRWLWDFGDGESLTTTSPGRPGTLEIAHAYQRVGHLSVRVTVEWTGTFRIAGVGEQYPINGTARVTSGTVELQSVAARTELVDR